MKKIDAIQDLRGIAVLYVVAFHAGMINGLDIFSHGASGVALFFVISGFIISFIHKDDKGLKSALIFIKKRSIRIYPPYIILLLLCILLFAITGKGTEYHRDAINIIRNLLLIHPPSQSIHPYSWTLVYEIYYYVTFCFFVILLRVNVISYAAILSFLPLLIISSGIDINNDIIIFGFSNLYFCVGAIIGATFDRVRLKINSHYKAIGLLIFFSIPFHLQSGWSLLAASTILFIAYAKSHKSYSLLSIVGSASYSIYLTHAIVLMILKTLFETRNEFTFIIMFIASVFSGWLYYKYIERPTIHFISRVLRLSVSRTQINNHD